MSASNNKMISKLRNALNLRGHKIAITKTEVFLQNKVFPSTLYTIKKAEYNAQTGKNKYKELFKTFAEIQVVLYLRDYWYILNNEPLPEADDKWEAIRVTLHIQEEVGDTHGRRNQ